MFKNSFYHFIISFFGITLFTSCATLLGSDTKECSCMYFDYQTGIIASGCGPGNCGGEKIVSIRVNTVPSSNVEFNTILLDSNFTVPSYSFKTTLSSDALNRVKNKGISIIVYTQQSGVWYTLNADPGAFLSKSRFYFTSHR